ncbi:hypothetical protein TKK_0019003 [Trichogramma kaykai]
MHDITEGIAAYTVGNVLQALIESNVISLDTINNRISSFKYNNIEKSNKPRPLFYSGSELKLKQSSAEQLCLARYLCLMIGDKIPPGNKYWKLYLCLRKIIDVLYCPQLNKGQMFNVRFLVQKHNGLYREFFGKLKPKMHLWVHYSRLLFLIGPLVQFSSMKFERQNKKLKEVVVGTTSNINLPMTIAIRNQLQFCHSFEYVPLSENSITKADLGEPVKNDFIESIFPKNENITKIKRFELRNKIFHDGTVFVAEINDDGPKFGIVKNIIHVRSKMYFHILEYKTLCFFKWFHAYKVISTDVENIISVDLIPNFPPCLYVQKNYDEFIATRFSL